MQFKVGKGWHDNLVVELDGKFVKLSNYDFDGWLVVLEDGIELGSEGRHSVYGRTSTGERYSLDWDDSFKIDYKDTNIYSATATGGGNDFVRLSDEGGEAYTSDGKDKIIGGSGLDFIVAGAGNDKIIAGDDRDYIWGDGGRNKITGGDGADYFFFEGYDDTKTVIKDYNKEDTVIIHEIAIDPSDVHLRDTKNGAVMTYEYLDHEIEVLFEGAKAKSLTLDFRPD
jgi:Ca2+-binding RTX toxin-like protein